MKISSSYIYRAILLVNLFLLFGQSYSYAQFSMGNTLAPLPGNLYPIVYSNDVKGGFHQVATIAERNAIPALRRQLGMVCTVLDAGSGTPVTYQLLGGLLDANWTVFASSAATSGNFADLTNKPTTIAGYGITDATTITGTANQISVSASSGAVTLSLPATITGLTSVTSTEFVGALTGNASTVTTNANLTGEVTSVGNATTVGNTAVIGKVLTGFTSGTGTITATDNILQAIQKLDGNIATGTGSMAGDVTGTVGANVVGKINGVALGTTTATDKNILVANGTNWSSQAMSGDVTIDNTGATTITDKAVTLAKMDDMATGSLIYRKTALAGAPEVQSLATLKTDLGLSGINTGDQVLPTLSSLGAVAGNAAITGATNTKITYDEKGLVTGGAAATTADIVASADKNYVTDAKLTVLNNTSGTNTGDQDLSALATTAATVAALNLKVDKETGKGLSTNDYTTAEQTKLASISGTNTGDQVLPTLTSLGAVAGNTAITGATNTKITYDAKGLVTAGAAATTADIAASADKNYVTDAKLAVLNNTSGTNTGDQDLTGLNHTNRVALDAVSGTNTGDQTLPTLSSLGAVAGNTAITAGTNTKITYDAKGLVTAGAAATTADIAASADKNYVTDAQQVVIGNTSGTNTGDQDLAGLGGVPTTRTVNGHALSSDVTVTASDVSMGNVTNESKATMFTSPTFTGTVSGVTAAMVGAPTGSGTSTGTNTGDQTITLTGDLTGTGTGSFATTLSTSGVTAATYGSATQVPVFAVDAKGRVTGVTNTTIAGTSPVGSALTSANILVGSASDLAAAVAMSGDVTIDNTGLTTIGTNKVDYGKIQAASTTKKILGSNDASTAVTELSLGFGLGMTGSVLSSTVLSDVSFFAPISYVIQYSGKSVQRTISMPAATSSADGYLTSADWSTFNKYNQWDGGSTGLSAETGRTSLGATTVGSNLFTLTDPSAVTFPRFNADNTVSALDAATFRSAIGAGTSSASGTVTSVSVTTANGVSGSVATNTTTPAISLTLGAITPTSVAASGTVAGSNLSGTNTGDNAVNTLYSGLTNYAHPTGDGNLHVIATSTTNSGKVLTAGATAGSLSWTTPAAGTVTSVSGTGTVSGLTLTGTVTTSGNLTLGGTLTETDPNVKAINGIVKSNGTTISAATQGTDYSLVREVAFETLAGAGQTNFYLDPTKPPSPNSKVKMYINGVRISNSAYTTPVMNLITYIPANNGSYTLTASDRIQFDYYY